MAWTEENWVESALVTVGIGGGERLPRGQTKNIRIIINDELKTTLKFKIIRFMDSYHVWALLINLTIPGVTREA